MASVNFLLNSFTKKQFSYLCVLSFLCLLLKVMLYFVGTVFREPILCKNIPRIVTGKVWAFASYIEHRYITVETAECFLNSQVGRNPYVLVGMLLAISIEPLIQLSRGQES